MLHLDQHKKNAGALKASVAAIKKAIDARNAAAEKFQSDTSRSKQFVQEQVATLDATMMPTILKELDSMREPAARAEADRVNWASRALLMSRIPFDANPAADAQIRMRYTAELAAMDAPLLILTMSNAIHEGNLALLWACVTAGGARGVQQMPDWSQVVIPQQVEALSLIQDCDAALAEAQMMVGAAGGMSMSPEQKLTFAHRMQPPTPKLGSPGRPVV